MKALKIATHQPILRGAAAQGGAQPRLLAQFVWRFCCRRYDVLEVSNTFQPLHELKETVIN
jgi:hypothetical protein